MYITAYSVGHSSMHRCIHTLDHGANCAFARALGSPLPLSLPLPPSLAHTQTLPLPVVACWARHGLAASV